MLNYVWGTSKTKEEEEEEKKKSTPPPSTSTDTQNWTLVPHPAKGAQLNATKGGIAGYLPSRLKVYSVDMGNKASKAVASALVGNSLLATTVGSQLTQCATLTGAAQIESLGLVALRIPLRGLVSLTGGSNAAAVQNISKMSRGAQVMEIGAKGNIIGAIATAAVQESIAIAYYMHGEMPGQILKHQSVTIGISALSGVGGGTVGAAIGTLTFPGIGTALGSLLGSYTGAFVPFFVRGDGVSHQVNEDPNAPSRKIKTIPALPQSVSTAELDDDWLEVVDCTSESYFRLSDAERERRGSNSSIESLDPNLPDLSAGRGTQGSGSTSSIRAFHQVLSAGFGPSATSISASTRNTNTNSSSTSVMTPQDSNSAVFMPSTQKQRHQAPLGDEDVVIYFQVEQD